MKDHFIIKALNLKMLFENSADALFSDLSFSVSVGDKVAVTGPSGCGKTTLLRCLAGLLEPTAGEIWIAGELLDAKSVWRLRGKIALVPQEADLGHGTASDFIERPFRYRMNMAKSGNLDRLPEFMQLLGLDAGLLDSTLGALSGGEKQRLALVSALLLDRPILLLDEVASALDDTSAERVFSLLSSLEDKTIIGVVHDGSKMPFATREIAICKGGGNGCG